MTHYLVSGVAGFIGSRAPRAGTHCYWPGQPEPCLRCPNEGVPPAEIGAAAGISLQNIDISDRTLLGQLPAFKAIIKLGGHEMISINRMIEILEELTGKSAQLERHPIHRVDILSNWADINKAKRLLGWALQVHLLNGMRQLVEWYGRERSWVKDLETS